jgi:hypothetical protein
MDALTCALAAQDDAPLLNRSPAQVQQYLGQGWGAHGPQLVHVELGTQAPAPGSPCR